MHEVVVKSTRPKIIGSFPFCYRNLMKICWKKDPNKRPTFDQIVDMLRSDPEFIMNDVNRNEYLKYIASIDPLCSPFQIDDSDGFEESFQLEKEITPSFKFISINEYKKMEKIGSGRFVSVFKVQNKGTKQLFAAKIMKLNDENKGSDIEIKNKLEMRYEKMTILLFPSILKFIGYSPYDFQNRINPTIFTELANMSLKDVIELERFGKAPSDWTLTKKLINIYGIASAMKYLHSKNIIHRNLNLKSILLDDSLYPKICDFLKKQVFV